MSFSNSRPIAWMVWIIASIFYAYQYILRVMPSIMLDDIMKEFGIGAAAFGQFSGVYYIGYSLMHLPIGIMLDRFGPRKIMTGCILLTLVGLTPLIFAEHWIYPIFGRLLIGMGSSAAILGLFKIIRMTFSENLFPRMLSLSVTIGLMGAIYGGGPVSYLRDVFGFITVVQGFIAGGIILAIATYCIVPDIKASSQSSVAADIKSVLGNRKVILSCIFAGLMVGPLEGFADVWGSSFLSKVYGFDGPLAASLPSMIFVGMCFGSPVLSYIAEKIGSFPVAIVGAGIFMSSLFILMLAFPLGTSTLSAGYIGVGICCAYQILAIYKVSTYVPPQVAGLTTAVANMIIMIFGYAFHTMIGMIINYTGGADSPNALVYGVAVIPVGLVIGTCGFLGIIMGEKKLGYREA